MKPKPVERSQKIRIFVGNHYELVDVPGKCVHSYTLYVNFEDPAILKKSASFINRVKWELHETYKNPIRETAAVNGKQFEFKARAWGWFDVPITIYWHSKTGLKATTVNHTLYFNPAGKQKVYEFEIKESYLKEILKN